MRIAEADVLPRFTGIGGFVNAIARDDVVTNIGFAGADIKNLGIGGRHRDRADTRTRTRQFAIGDVFPLNALVCAFPNAAAHRSGVKKVVVSGDAGHGDHASADVRANATPFQLAHQRLWSKGLWALRSCKRGRQCS